MTSIWKISLVSFLILFLELLLIRLIGTEIRIFAYLGNLILLATFVGSSLGLFIKKPLSITSTAVWLFFVTILVTTSYILRTSHFEVKLFSGISELLAPLSEAYVWQQLTTMSKTGAVLGIILTGGILLLLVAVFIPLGNLLGRLLDQHPRPLLAYSVNIFASLLGIWVFQLFSLLELSPLLGLVLGVGGLIWLTTNQAERYFAIAALLAVIALTTPKVAYQPYEGPVTFWSPYQKLTLSLNRQAKPYYPQGYYLEVNNVGYMGLLDLSSNHQATASALLVASHQAKPEEVKFLNQYDLPYFFKPHPQNVLIIGAGAGNDAAGSVRAKAQHIDAVEIDPTIIRLGKDYHAEKPYQQSAITTIATDGRAFMEQTQAQYDLIVMGLADSHTLSSSLTNLRLDHYLYTLESLQKAQQLLRPDGLLVLSFEVARPWIGDRLNATLTHAFGHPPIIFEVRSDGAFGWGGFFFVITKDPNTLTHILNSQPDLSQFVSHYSRHFDTPTQLLTDDWPYLYLDHPRLPLIHLLMALFFLIILGIVKVTQLKSTRLNWPMFFWGAAFLLFEFQNISKASLLFGLTWQTNLFTITAALIFILAANWVTAKHPLQLKTAFIGLIIALALQLVIPLHILNSFTLIPKFLIGGLLLNFPFFFGAIIFASWFVKAKDKSSALASNLLGSAFGGLLEMISFLTGIKFLLILTIAFYTLGLWQYHRFKVKLFSA